MAGSTGVPGGPAPDVSDFQAACGAKTVFMVTSGTSHGEAIGTLYGAPLYHASLAPEEYRRLLEAAGFHVVAHVAEDARGGNRTVWLAQCGG